MLISFFCLVRWIKTFAQTWKLASFLLLCSSNIVFGQISTTPSSYPYPAVNFMYTQNFTNLPVMSTYTSGITGKGPYFLGSFHAGLNGLFIAQTSGSNSALNFSTSAGSNSVAGIFSYGANNGPIRGLGSLASSAGSYIFGISFTNATNSVIEQFEIEFTAAQWRKGGSGKVGEWTFSYHTSATNHVLDTLTKKNTTLHFTSVQTSTGTAAINGLLNTNQQRKKDTLFNLNWRPGEQLILKWQDKDEVGNDDGMALQQLYGKALTLPDNTAPTVFALIPPPPKTYTTGDTLTAKIIFSEPCFLNSGTFNPYIVVTISDSVKNMSYTKGSGTNEWYFSYIIEKGDLVKNGLNIYPQINSNQGAIRDAALNICNGIITTNTRFLLIKIDAAPPAFIDTNILRLNSCKLPVTVLPEQLGVIQTDSSETIYWKLKLAPTQGEILGLPFSKKTVGDSAFPRSFVFIPSGTYTGIDSAIIEISDGLNSSFKKIMFQLDSEVVNNKITGDQIICSGFAPTLFIGSNLQNTSYQWIYKEDSLAKFKPVTGISNQYNYQAGTLHSSSLFKRIVTRFSCIDTSNTISVDVKNNGLWIGANDALWQVGSNWCGGLIPDSSTHVILQQGGQIIISNAFPNQTIFANTITLDSSAYIVVNGLLHWPKALLGSGTIDAANGSIYIESDSTIIKPNIFKNKLIYALQIDVKNKVQFLDSINISNNLTLFNGSLQTQHLTLLSAAQINSSGNNTGIIGTATVHKKYNLQEGQTKLLSPPFLNQPSLVNFNKSLRITGKGGSSSGFDSAEHEIPSAYFLDSTTNTQLSFIPFIKTDSGFWEQNRAIKIWLYPNDSSFKNETPFIETKKHNSWLDISIHGIPQHGPLEINFTEHPSTRYYLTGNPYPAAIDMRKITSSTNIGKHYWYWDAGLGATGNYTARPFRFPNIIQKLEGYIIKNNAGAAGYLFYEERTKVNHDEAPDTTRYKKEYAHISLQLMQENNLLDRLEIMGIDSASSRFEKWDAEKINENQTSLYSISRDSVALCIDARPFTNNLFIPLGIKSNKTGKYKLVCSAYLVENSLVAYLHDKLLNKYQKIMEDSSYAFEISTDTTTAGERRFEITGPPPPPRQEDPIIAVVTPNPVHDQLGIRFSFREPLAYQISIHHIDGTLLQNKTFAASKNGFASIDVRQLKAGTYVAVIKAGKNYLLKQFIKL